MKKSWTALKKPFPQAAKNQQKKSTEIQQKNSTATQD